MPPDAPPPIEALPERHSSDIRYEDDQLLVVDKPAGMVVHPAYGNRTGTLVNALLHHVGAEWNPLDSDEPVTRDEDVDSEECDPTRSVCRRPMHSADIEGDVIVVRPGIVHRLDKDTSGLYGGREEQRCSCCSRQAVFRADDRETIRCDPSRHAVAERRAHRNVSRAEIPAIESEWLFRVEVGRGLRPSLPGARAWRTSFAGRVHARNGRTHQIRVHAAHMGIRFWATTPMEAARREAWEVSGSSCGISSG
jgi:23S rRNA pseudouridine1911/1915/1917 synthase